MDQTTISVRLNLRSRIFGVLLPEAYSNQNNSNCQDAAEQVIDTLKVLPE